MKAILLAGQNPQQTSLPVSLVKFNNELLLDKQIKKLVDYGFDTAVVLDGVDADQVLRQSKMLPQTELIYDTNDIPSFMTNFRSALYSTFRECFVLPLWHQIPPKKAWQQLVYSYYHRELQKSAHVVEPYCPIHGEMRPGFPLLITQLGRSFLKGAKDIHTLNDPRVIRARVAVLQPTITTQVNLADQDLPDIQGHL